MRYALYGIVMVLFGGIAYMLYIVFNYALLGSKGLKPIMWDVANKSLTGDHLTRWNEMMISMPEWLRITFFLIFASAIILFLIDAFERGPREMT